MVMKNKLKYYHITLKGVNLNRIYKQCKMQNIEMHNIDRKNYKHLEFDVDYRNKKKIKEYIKSQNYDYEEQQSAISKAGKFFVYRFGIIIGILFFLITNIVSGFFVWDIRVYGNESVSKEIIISVLNNDNIRVGSIVNSSKLQNAENTLTNNIEDISLCSIIKKGTVIIVNIKEKLKNEEITSMYNGKDIVATENMTITELNVANGTAKKKVGDSVKQGEIIVAGYVINSSGKKITCKANASVKGKTWRTATETYYKQIEVNNRTGKKSVVSYLSLFGNLFPVKCQKNNFELYEEEEKEVVLMNNFLPFKMLVTTQYEITKQMVEQNFENDKEIVLERCQKNAYAQVKNGDHITKIFDTISEEKDCFVVTSYIEVLIELG